jgi:hypothetical protein
MDDDFTTNDLEEEAIRLSDRVMELELELKRTTARAEFFKNAFIKTCMAYDIINQRCKELNAMNVNLIEEASAPRKRKRK